MVLTFCAFVLGMILLVWSADRFVGGASAFARHLGMPPLLIGMVIVGFGTSAPELVVSAFAAAQGNPGIALGNGYGSNIANIGLILGLAALIRPLTVHSRVVQRELPIIGAVTALSAWFLWDGRLSRIEAAGLLILFGGLMAWTAWQAVRSRHDALEQDVVAEHSATSMPLRRTVLWLVVGLIGLLASSRALVWAAVRIAEGLGVSDLIIGLTIVAVGTSLPELAASVTSALKGEHDLAVGNVVGSNLFNTLAVVGLAGVIRPMEVGPEVLIRDLATVAAMSALLFLVGFGFRRQGRINRFEGAGLLLGYAAYITLVIARPVGF